MDTINGEIRTDCIGYKDFPSHVGETVCMKGIIHRIREMTGFAFVIIRTARETVQCVYSPDFSDYRMGEEVTEGCSVKLTGKIVKDETREGRFEMQIHGIDVLSSPAEQMPLVINKKQLDNIPIDLNLNLRPVTLRNPKERAVFKVQEGIARGVPRISLFAGIHRDPHAQDLRTGRGGAARISSSSTISASRCFWRRARSSINRCSSPSTSACSRSGPCSVRSITTPPATSTSISAWTSRWGSSTAFTTS